MKLLLNDKYRHHNHIGRRFLTHNDASQFRPSTANDIYEKLFLFSSRFYVLNVFFNLNVFMINSVNTNM